MKDIRIFSAFYALCLLVQVVGGWLTASSVTSWYPTLEKSSLTPPGYVFGIVWSVLYLLMAVAAWRVWRAEQRLHTPAQRLWLAQLLTGLLWSAVFFGLKMPHAGLAVIACVWVLVLLTLRAFWRIDRLAGLLLLPLMLWGTFATYLQLVIALHN